MTLVEANREREELLKRPLDYSKLGDAEMVENWKKQMRKFQAAKSLADIEQGLNYFRGFFK